MSDLPGTWDTNRAASTASDALPTRDDLLTIADVCVPTPDAITATTAREFLSGPTLGHVLVRGVVEAHRDASSLATLATFDPASVNACLPDLVQKVFGGAAVLGDVEVAASSVDGVTDARGFSASIHLSGGEAAFDITLQHRSHVISHPSRELCAHLLLPGVEVVACVEDFFTKSLAPQCRVAGTSDL